MRKSSKPSWHPVSVGWTVEVDGAEVEVTVQGRYKPGTPDVWYLKNGDPGYPGDPPEVELDSVIADDSKMDLLDKLSAEQREGLEQLVTEKADLTEYED